MCLKFVLPVFMTWRGGSLDWNDWACVLLDWMVKDSQIETIVWLFVERSYISSVWSLCVCVCKFVSVVLSLIRVEVTATIAAKSAAKVDSWYHWFANSGKCRWLILCVSLACGWTLCRLYSWRDAEAAWIKLTGLVCFSFEWWRIRRPRQLFDCSLSAATSAACGLCVCVCVQVCFGCSFSHSCRSHGHNRS